MKVSIHDKLDLENQTFTDGKKVWFVSRLIDKSKDLPVQTMAMSALNIFNLYPNIKTMQSFVNHIQKVLEADLKYPIILDEEGYCMDGRHRIAKALLEGKETIKFVRFPATPGIDYLKEED